MLSGYKNDDSDQDKQYGGYGMENYQTGMENIGVDPYHQEQEVDQKGFEKRVQGDQDIFIFKNIVLPGIPTNQRIKKLIVSEQTKVIITQSSKIYRWRIKNDAQFRSYELPELQKQTFGGFFANKQKQINIKMVYLDAKGHHCIIVAEGGNNYYLNYRQNKIRYLNKLKGCVIKALAFHSMETEMNKTGDVIFSTQNGVISLYRLQMYQNQFQENLTASILQIYVTTDIMSIQILRLTQNQGQYVIIIFSTISSIFCITGPDDIEVLLNKFKDQNQRVKDIPMPKGYQCLIHTCYSKITKRPTSILWTNGSNLIHFKIPDADQKITDNFLTKNQIYRYAKKTDLPIQKAYQVQQLPLNIGITDFHYYILFQESITILSTVTQKVVAFEQFKGLLMKDMVYEKNTGIFWIYSQKGITKLDTSREGTQAWKLLLAQKRYKQAYNVCKAKNENLSYVAGLYADFLFEKRQYIKSASLFSETSRTFEQIFLKYLQVNNDEGRQGLQIYLKSWLKKLSPQQKSQRCLLISWLIELIVYQLNNLDREKLTAEGQQSIEIKKKLKQKQTDLQFLLDDNIGVINEDLVYLIMQSHGRIQNLINFADKKNNFQMIVVHYLSQENYSQALQYLKNVKDPKVVDVIYKYAHIFFRYETQKTVSLLKNSIRQFKPIKLMPGLMNIPDSKRTFGVQLLKYCVEELRSKQKSLHNILIFFFATSSKEKHPQLIQMMKKGKLDFDLDFGLRLFKTYKMSQAQIIVYGKMYLYAQAVSLALQNNKQQLAKQYAEKPDYEDEKKKLWIQIAKHFLVKKGKIKQVIDLTKSSEVIKIEDLLPHFNQNIKIQNFKDEICQSLKSYSQQISKLKNLMDSYATNAQQLKNQLKMVKNRCIQIDSSHKCQQCYKTLFTQQFYIFPCMHGFHRQCLYQAFKHQPTFDHMKVEKIQALNDDIRGIQDKVTRRRDEQMKVMKGKNENSGFSFMNFGLFGMVQMGKQQSELRVKREQIDSMLASQCIYCGPGVVDTITMPFSDDYLRDSWKI